MGGPEMLTHHIAALAAVAASASIQQAHMYALIMLATESTTPFINARWMFDKLVGFCFCCLAAASVPLCSQHPSILSPRP